MISFLIFKIFTPLEIVYTKRLTVMLFFLQSNYIKKTRMITTKSDKNGSAQKH
jgi:hypothetical protein